jgi:branched-subunit amino acid ABC-type transport system permease component
VDLQLIGIGIATGIGLGSIYVLLALSYTLILASSGVFNFAQEALVTCGAVAAFVLGQRYGIPLLFVVGIIAMGGALAGLISDRVAVRPFLNRPGSLTHEALVSTMGLGLVITAVVAITFGVDSEVVPSYVSPTPVRIGSVPVRPIYILMLAVAAAIALTLELVMARTRTGMVLRATILDREGAGLLGIDPGKVVAASFALAGVLGALAGFLIVPVTNASPFVGGQISVYGFAAMAIGGFGSFRGAMVGGIIVGLVVGITPVYLDPAWAQPLVYALLLLVLIVRPTGLFGTAGQFGSARLREV